MKATKTNISLGILMVFYTVGVFGILGDDPLGFASMTPINLMLSGLVLWINHEKWTTKAAMAILFAGLVGFAIEVVGVKTGVIFGSYHYGENMGSKLFDVPLTIGLNWAILSYCSIIIANRLFRKTVAVASLSASFMVGLDYLIEPIAIKLDFWNWQGDIPVQNFIAWWIISFIINLVAYPMMQGSSNKLALPLFILQVLFFGILNIFM